LWKNVVAIHAAFDAWGTPSLIVHVPAFGFVNQGPWSPDRTLCIANRTKRAMIVFFFAKINRLS